MMIFLIYCVSVRQMIRKQSKISLFHCVYWENDSTARYLFLKVCLLGNIQVTGVQLFLHSVSGGKGFKRLITFLTLSQPGM